MLSIMKLIFDQFHKDLYKKGKKLMSFIQKMEFSIRFKLYQPQIVFEVQNKDQHELTLICILERDKLNSPFLSLEFLHELLLKQQAKLSFSIQTLELQIKILVGKVKRYIYLPIINNEPKKSKLFFIKSMQKIQLYVKDITIKVNEQINYLKQQIIRNQEQYENYRAIWCQKKSIIKSHQQQITALVQQDLKLNRQILTIDEEIMSCKRGVQLQQYRIETNLQNRQQRKRKVHLGELSKIANPKIQKIIREKNYSIVRLQLGQCELKSMKFVQIFQCIQELKLPKNNIRKIQGLVTLLQLRKVQLQANSIERIEGFNNNLQIRQLRLQKNKITKFENIFHLCRLQILSLSQNLIEQIPSQVKMLECLFELRLINNNISHLPSQILSLNKLRTLSINGNPCLKDNNKSKQIFKGLAVAQVEINSSIA